MIGLSTLMKQGLRRTPLAPVTGPADTVKTLIGTPSVARLVWALFQDPRVPVWNKAGALACLAVVVSPRPAAGHTGDWRSQ